MSEEDTSPPEIQAIRRAFIDEFMKTGQFNSWMHQHFGYGFSSPALNLRTRSLMPYRHLHHARHVIKRLEAKLHVIAVVFNPLRFLSRYNLFRDFERHAIASGAELRVVELAYGDRPFEVTEAGHPNHIQFRTEHELWHKERMINAAVSRLPANWQYVSWVDADVTFINTDWVHETLQQLQHFDVVQMFTHAMDVGPNGEPIQSFESFANSYVRGDRPFPRLNGVPSPGSSYYGGDGHLWHPGYAWAYRRSAWDTLGGLLDCNIVGGGDHQMAYGYIGRVNETIPYGGTHQYNRMVRNWAVNAELLKRNIGAVPGTLVHHFHGKKKQRNYDTRWRILTDNGFDPLTDLKNDWQGLIAHAGYNWKLRDDLRAYFRSRQEDSID